MDENVAEADGPRNARGYLRGEYVVLAQNPDCPRIGVRGLPGLRRGNVVGNIDAPLDCGDEEVLDAVQPE